MVALGRLCCTWALSSGEWGLLFVGVHALLVAGLILAQSTGSRASVVAAPRLSKLRRMGWAVVAHSLSCPAACGIFPDQGSNPCLRIGRPTLIHCTTREVLNRCFVSSFSSWIAHQFYLLKNRPYEGL